MPISTLPPAPLITDPPDIFDSKASAHVASLSTLVTEMNAAIAAVNMTMWVSGTTYAIGDVTWSPITFYAYRRKTAGAGTTDPSADSTNWILIDNVIVGAKHPCRSATTANITLSGSAPNTLDGVTLAANDRILVKNQSTASQNGLYYVSTLGTGSDGTWTRAPDADSTGTMFGGMLVAVSEGTANADSIWMLTTNDPITIGTTALAWQRKDAGAAAQPGANADITSLNAPALGAATATTPSAGDTSTRVATTAFVTAAVPTASTTVKGIVELATSAEAIAGTDAVRAITPATLFGGLNASGTAPIFACRAWVNFNGTGTVAIRASGNVSSITDNGVGDYTVNFTTAMQDANYSIIGTSNNSSYPAAAGGALVVEQNYAVAPTTSAVAILIHRSTVGYVDNTLVCVSIFR
jgi:phage-related tail fiber protein